MKIMLFHTDGRIIAILSIIAFTFAATRLLIYGFDFGLVDVWSGEMEMNWVRTGMDAIAGATGGAAFGLYLRHRK